MRVSFCVCGRLEHLFILNLLISQQIYNNLIVASAQGRVQIKLYSTERQKHNKTRQLGKHMLTRR